MKIFLRAKHWQLFLLTFVLPFILMSIFMVSIIVSARNHLNGIADFTLIKYVPLFSIVFMGLVFGWVWSIAVELQQYVPQNIKLNLIQFKIFFFIPMIYITGLYCFMFLAIRDVMANQNNLLSITQSITFIIIPLHLFSMFCLFYCLYFAAKSFKTAELQRKVTFSDFAGEFFMMWFSFIGVWILQPKINKIIEPNYQPPTYW